MIEVEVKAPAGPGTREELVARGEPVGEVVQEDVYYQHPCRDLASTDEALRIRRVDGEAEWTYKGPRRGGETKTRRELGSGLADGDAVGASLEALGFEPLPPVRKDRERFDLGSWTAVLDDVQGLGRFVELERLVEDGRDVEALEAEALDLLDELATGEPEPRSYLELVLEAGD
jgi:adenylate cyclase class 2